MAGYDVRNGLDKIYKDFSSAQLVINSYTILFYYSRATLSLANVIRLSVNVIYDICVSKIAETSTRHGFSFTTFPRPSVYSKKVIFTYFIKNSHRSRSVLSMKQIYWNQEVRAIFLGTGAHFINLICEIK